MKEGDKNKVAIAAAEMIAGDVAKRLSLCLVGPTLSLTASAFSGMGGQAVVLLEEDSRRR